MRDEALPPTPAPSAAGRRPAWAGWLLGFGLGGFFDGILLHQVLQWHHLLSALDGPAFADLRVQVLADGLFHVLMYVVTAVGLALLWRSRRVFGAPGAGRRLLGRVLVGFGAWHIADGILSHWLLGIHRVRMDSENVLLWDLLWFAVFGVAVVLIGWRLSRGAGPEGGARRRVPGYAAPLLLAAAVTGAGAAAALPVPGVSTVMVVFGPGSDERRVLVAAAAVDARIVWGDSSGALWAFHFDDPGRAGALYRHGALLVGTSVLPAGCLAWLRPGLTAAAPTASRPGPG